MQKDQGARRRFRLRKADRIILAVLAIISTLMIALIILRNNGLYLVHGEYYVLGPLVMLVVVMGWGVYALFRRLTGRTARMVVAMVGALVIMMVLSTIMNFVSAYISLAVLSTTTNTKTSRPGIPP